MIQIQMEDIDLEKISRSGQCFRMNRTGENEYMLIAFGEYLELKNTENGILLSCTEKEWDGRWKKYFDCETNYDAIYRSVDKEDSYLQTAVSYGSGIRILRQELFETTISFIISQQNNIPRIKKCVEALCRYFGEERYNYRGEKYYTFPTPERLSCVKSEELTQCSLGYRSRYILRTAEMIQQREVEWDGIARMPYEEAKKELMKLCGVGVKVAECICLFALHHVDAFPIDTHIQSVLVKNYPCGFPFERYKGYAGILQQYAFFYDIYGEM